MYNRWSAYEHLKDSQAKRTYNEYTQQGWIHKERELGGSRHRDQLRPAA